MWWLYVWQTQISKEFERLFIVSIYLSVHGKTWAEARTHKEDTVS